MTPLLFNLRSMAPSAALGMPPFTPAASLPLVMNTPFGVTGSDIKGPTVPKPILLPILRNLKFAGRTRQQPMPVTVLRIFGVTKDSVGSVLASCTVALFETLTNKYIESTISDDSGNYEFRSASLSTTYYVVAYKAGSPDVAGTTINTLVGV